MDLGFTWKFRANIQLSQEEDEGDGMVYPTWTPFN